MELAEYLPRFIEKEVEACAASGMFRPPLVGYSSARDPLYAQLKHIVGEYHAMPEDILPAAQTVVSFFIPFAVHISHGNRGGAWPSRDWALCYINCNALINDISEKLVLLLQAMGLDAATVRATHTYSAEKLESSWSHKSAAFIAGMGSFGLNRLLITPAGAAGRFGSVLVSAQIEPTGRVPQQYCIHMENGGCGYCVQNCPVHALADGSFDKFKCNTHLLEADARFPELGKCDVCGKCAVGPCAALDVHG